MWILESRGDFFQGRRMWLKPGKQYLFGRVKKDGVRFALDHKTVSRKHFVIRIDDVNEADVGNTLARTTVTITDQGSKTGTSVNGERAKEPRILTRTENVIRLGTCQEELVVKWEPVILTFNLLKKELKAGLLRAKQERIRELDIKAISEFIPGTSTLLVVNKRNTAKGLQALIDGKYLVAESYLDALDYAATPTDLEEEENLSLLELDFDKAWPNPASHLPPQGKEPTLRSDGSYMPDPARANIFHEYTFVFADQTQYDNLLPPITTGHGKALKFSYQEGETTSDDLIAYMRQCVGSKHFGDDHKDTEEGAVILVRWTSKSNAEWTNHLINEVALKLDQRVIEQSEFLDAILASDASILRRSVPYESTPSGQIPPQSTSDSIQSNGLPSRSRSESAVANGTATNQAPPDSSKTISPNEEAEISNPSSPMPTGSDGGPAHTNIDQSANAASFRFSPRLKLQSSAFDDDFDEDAVIPFEEDEDNTPVQLTNGEQSDLTSPLDVDSQDEATRDGRSSRKRSRSAVSTKLETSDDHDLDEFLPTSTAIKRRKIAQNGQVKTANAAKQPSRGGVVLPAPKKKSLRELDIKEELRARQEKAKMERETRLTDDEDGQNAIEYDEQGKIVVYEVQTEYLDLPVRTNMVEAAAANNNDRWDPKWNGRKNFKAFRRARDNAAGATEERRRAHTRLIVPLVEAKQATYGIGDQYWERTDADRERDKERKKRASQRTTQSQPNSSDQQMTRRSAPSDLPIESDEEAEAGTVVEEGSSPVSPAVARLQQEAIEILDDEIDVDQPRQTRANDTRPPSSSNTQGQTQASIKSTRGTKRPGSISRGSAVKRQKSLPVTTTHGDSDDGDDLKFKFGSRRRGRGRGKA